MPTTDFTSPDWAHELANANPFPRNSYMTDITADVAYASPFSPNAALFSETPSLICNKRGKLIRMIVEIFTCPEYDVLISHWSPCQEVVTDPHDSPLDYHTYVLKGGYTEIVTYEDGRTAEFVFRQGDRYHSKAGRCSQFKNILPGTETMTIIMIDENKDLGQLDDEQHVPQQDDPKSAKRLRKYMKLNWFRDVLAGAGDQREFQKAD